MSVGSDEPIEHWAPPDSLDPTPVWRQYLLVAVIGLALFAFAVVYAYVAFLPDVVTAPAALPGRVVLPALQYAPGTAQKVTLAGADQTFYLAYAAGEPIAVRAKWSPAIGGVESCVVVLPGEPIPGAAEALATSSDPSMAFVDSCTRSAFNSRGEVVAGPAPRGLDRYLVSRKGDRLVVNTDHIIRGTP